LYLNLHQSYLSCLLLQSWNYKKHTRFVLTNFIRTNKLCMLDDSLKIQKSKTREEYRTTIIYRNQYRNREQHPSNMLCYYIIRMFLSCCYRLHLTSIILLLRNNSNTANDHHSIKICRDLIVQEDKHNQHQ